MYLHMELPDYNGAFPGKGDIFHSTMFDKSMVRINYGVYIENYSGT